MKTYPRSYVYVICYTDMTEMSFDDIDILYIIFVHIHLHITYKCIYYYTHMDDTLYITNHCLSIVEDRLKVCPFIL